MKKIKSKKGFTIVELVIVIGVIGILAGILIPTFVNVTQQAEAAALKSDLANAYSAYVADAADGVLDQTEAVSPAYDSGKKYTLELVEQDKAVLVKDAVQYHFDGEWKKATSALSTATVVTVSDSSAATVTYGGFTVYKLTA